MALDHSDSYRVSKQLKLSNHMKKIYFIIAAAAMFFAVEASAQIGVGVGYNMLNHVQKAQDEHENSTLNGFYIEATYDLNLLVKSWGEIGFQPGLRFSYGGEHETEEVMGVKGKASWNETYLDIPVLVKYSYDLDFVKVSAFAGPVLSCGLSSATKVSIGDNTTKSKNYGDDSVYERFDVKFGLGVGATFMEKFNAKIGYNAGLYNRYTDGIDDFSCHTGVFYIGIGYNF